MATKRRVNRKTPRKKKQAGAVMPFITGICFGLFIAFIVYLKYGDISTPDKNQPIKAETPAIEFSHNEEVEEKEKPQFDFYTILPEREVKVPEWEPPKQKTATGKKVETGSYVFQVGSFQKHSEADSVKAELVMMGFPVEIQRVVINGQKVWFRVRVGPYTDESKLNGVRKRLSANQMDYILLRIKNDT